MPSLVEKMQPWTQAHNIIPANLLRRSWSSSSSSIPLTSSSSTNSLISGGSSTSNGGSGGGPVSCNSSSPRAGGGTGSGNSHQSLFSKICSAGSNGNSASNNTANNNNNNNVSRTKRKTPILSTCMNNWVKFDHDCQKPLHCAECESNQERNRKVLFTSGGNVLISTSGKGKHHHHRHSHLISHRNHHHVTGTSLSEPSSPTDSGNSSCNSAFSGEVVSWENVKSSFKIVINVPYLDVSLFQNENIQVEIVCNKNKVATGKDFTIVQRNRSELRCSGWYWEGIDSEASMEILESAQPGAFIIRDSADPRFLYSLSVQTERGPTSVRLTYRNGKFSLDADEKLVELLPKFDSVIRLIEHYVNGGTKVGKQVWVDPKGKMHSTVKLTKPVRKDVGSLKHLTRVAINRHNLLSSSNSSSAIPAANPSSSASIKESPNTKTATINTTASSCVRSNSPCSSKIANDGSSPTPSKDENSAAIVSRSPTTADLRLPMSLQTYMQEYPYYL